jgi:hypothetical protein
MTAPIEPRQSIARLSADALWLQPSERDGDTRRTDPTRPFAIRAGHYLRFGFGGYWGSVWIEVRR